MSYKNAIKLIRCLKEREYVSVRNIMDKWPQSEFKELLNLISCVVTTLHEKETDDDFSFNRDVSKALMIAACESQEFDDLWNIGINDEVPIHFDTYKAFLCACKNGNIRMVKDFRRFQYDEEDGKNMIPDSVWLDGLKMAKESSNKETAEWIKKYLQNGTDDEDSDFEESGDEDGMDDCMDECDENCGEDCECKESIREVECYNRIHTRLVNDRKKRREEDNDLVLRMKNL
jgi:hypothetical protein